jgi:hypothetical protein
MASLGIILNIFLHELYPAARQKINVKIDAGITSSGYIFSLVVGKLKYIFINWVNPFARKAPNTVPMIFPSTAMNTAYER